MLHASPVFVTFHLGDKLPDVVSFFQNKKPDLKTFSDYLDFLYLMHECHIISEEQLNRSLAGENGEVFQVLMNHPEPEYFFALSESLRRSHYYSVNETQFIIQISAVETATHNTHRFFKSHKADMPEVEMAIIKALDL